MTEQYDTEPPRARVWQAYGKWFVSFGNETHKATSNAHAWRIADRLNREPQNRSQDAHDWSFRQNASRE